MNTLRVSPIILTPLVLSLLALMPADAQDANKTPRKHPHLAFDISAAAIDAATRQTVDRTEPIDETIQDLPVQGIGRTIAIARAEIVPDAHRGVVDFVLQGANWSRTIGERHTIRIDTSAKTTLDVRHRVVFDGAGIQLFQGPMCADSSTQCVDIFSIMDFDSLAINMAKRAFNNSQAAAEAESAAKTARHASDRLHDELVPNLDAARKRVGAELTNFKRGGLSLESLDFQSTTTSLQARLRFVPRSKEVPNIMPSLPADTDIGMRLHQSMANQAAQATLAGRTFELSKASELHHDVTRGFILDAREDADKKLGLKKIEKLLSDLLAKPVTIKLAEQSPVWVTFGDQGFSVEVNVDSIRQGKIVYAGIQVRAVYRFENTKNRVEAERQGLLKITVHPADPKRKMVALPAEFVIAQEVLFGEVFTERIALGPLPLPDPVTQLRLEPPRAYGRDGWFALTWKMQSK